MPKLGTNNTQQLGHKSSDKNMAAEVKVFCDMEGFFKCEKCQKRFFAKIVLKIYSSNYHKKDSETKTDQIQQSPPNNSEIAFQQMLLSTEKCNFLDLLKVKISL